MKAIICCGGQVALHLRKFWPSFIGFAAMILLCIEPLQQQIDRLLKDSQRKKGLFFPPPQCSPQLTQCYNLAHMSWINHWEVPLMA